MYKVFKIDAAHSLPHVPEGHPCARLHGHTFRIVVYVEGPLQPGKDWVMDFADIVGTFRPVEQMLDHKCLNEIEGLENPTSENLARWIWQRLQPALPGLCRIVVEESPESGCIYEGN